MKLMTNKHIRHLPVVENGKVVGVISIGDLVKEIIADRETMIKSLENYITGQGIVG
jgi:CBS domain-containing protein